MKKFLKAFGAGTLAIALVIGFFVLVIKAPLVLIGGLVLTFGILVGYIVYEEIS